MKIQKKNYLFFLGGGGGSRVGGVRVDVNEEKQIKKIGVGGGSGLGGQGGCERRIKVFVEIQKKKNFFWGGGGGGGGGGESGRGGSGWM